MRRFVHRRRGSALRFSRPLSGLPAHPSFAGLFHPAAVRGVLPSERCPSPGSRTLSRGRSAPLQFSVAVPEVRCVRPRPPGFTDSHAFAWFAWLPPELGRRFGRVLPRLPRRRGPHPPGPPRSCGFVCFEALIPPRIGTHVRRLPDDREPMLSWVFAPPEPSSDRASGPPLTRRTVPSAAELAPRRREGLLLAGG